MKLLIVDDNPESRLLLRKQLGNLGHEILEAAEGGSALQQAREHKPDLVICDVMMPNIDGYELCRRIRADPTTRDISMVFYSANYLTPEAEQLALDTGASFYLRKPAEPDEFASVIEGILSGNSNLIARAGGADSSELIARHQTLLTNQVAEQADWRRNLLESMIDGFLLIDSKGKIIDSNAGYQHISGFSANELKRMQIDDLETTAEQGRTMKLIRRAQRKGLRHITIQHRRKNGRVIALELSLAILPIAGKDENTALLIRDVTQPRLLGIERRRLRRVMDESLNEIYMFDQKTFKFIYANGAALRNLGYSRSEILRMSTLDITPDFDATSLASLVDPLVQGLESKLVFESIHLRDNGSVYPVEVHLQLVREDPKWFFLALILDISERKEAERAIYRLSQDMMRAEETERRRIARELHDSTAQDVVAVLLNIESVSRAIAEHDPRLAQALESSLAMLEHAANDLRTLSYGLYPPLLSDHGLMSAIEQFAAGFSERTDIAIDLQYTPKKIPTNEGVEIVLFRVVQESLNNAWRHSGARQIEIAIDEQDGVITLRVSDDGHGFDTESATDQPGAGQAIGVGIRAMRERVRQVGGRFAIASGAGGTAVTAEIPLPVNAP